MRVLLTSQLGDGHWRPLAGLAVELEAAGHRVAFVSTPATCRSIRRHGFACFAAGVDDCGRVEQIEPGPETQDVEPASEVWRHIFAGRRVDEMLPQVLEVVRAWRPDLIVREISEFAGLLAAEVVGIPHAVLQVSAWRPEIYRMVAEPLGQHRAAIGLPPDPDSSSLYRHLLLSPEPLAFRDPRRPFPPTVLPVRVPLFDAATDSDVLPQLPASTRPLIYATLGTAYNQQPQLFQAIIDAVDGLDVNLVMTTGVDPECLRLDIDRHNVMVRDYVPQSKVLPRCDLVISHAGFGTVQAALRHGLPQILLPSAADQPDNARHCEARGVARVLWSDERSVPELRHTVESVVDDAVSRERVSKWQQAISELPGSSAAIDALSALAGPGVSG